MDSGDFRSIVLMIFIALVAIASTDRIIDAIKANGCNLQQEKQNVIE